MDKKSLETFQAWAQENLVTRKGAAKITGQSYAGFSQAINRKVLTPFLEFDGEPATSLVRLYLKSDVEKYAEQLKEKKTETAISRFLSCIILKTIINNFYNGGSMNKKYIVAIGSILLIVLTIIAFTVSNKTETQSQNTVQSTTTSQSSELAVYPSLNSLREKYGQDLIDLGSSQITTVLFEKKNVAFITSEKENDIEFPLTVTDKEKNLFQFLVSNIPLII